MVLDEGGGSAGVLSPEAALAVLGRMRLEGRPLAEILDRVAQLAMAAVPGCGAASVTLVRPGGAVTVGVTGPLVAELDERQYAEGFGPCMAAAVEGATVTIPDTAAATEYADFAALARRHGVTSVLSVGLPLRSRAVGSLNVYRTGGGALDAGAVERAQEFAHCVAAAVANAADYAASTETARRLRQAMQSRAVIEQAKGVLMARHLCSADAAFARLAAESQRTNRKLRDIAAEVVDRVQRQGAAHP